MVRAATFMSIGTTGPFGARPIRGRLVLDQAALHPPTEALGSNTVEIADVSRIDYKAGAHEVGLAT